MEVEDAEIQTPSGHAEPNNKDTQDSTKGSSSKKRKQREFTFPAMDRPARERKSIERLIVSPDKEVKEFNIQKGSGTALKDIPNIVFKLSKRRTSDEAVQALYKVLFGRTSVKLAAKGNILRFSGYVWSGDEEKEKARAKERLERCVKENLFQISDLLDLPLSRLLKKEDVVLKIFEFLESPHKTTDKLVEESSKPKRGKKAKKTPGKGSKRKVSGKSPKKDRKGVKKTSRKKQSSDEEDVSDTAELDEDIEEPEDKSDDDHAKESSSAKKRKRKSSEKAAVQEREEEEPLPKKKKPKKVKVEKEKEKPVRQAKKEKEPKKKAAKVEEPSDEDLREAICELLQNADFSKVTFTDVMKQLGEKFNTDLTHRKAQLKAMIQEEIHKLVGEGEDGDNESEIDSNGDKAKGDEQDEHEDASGDVKAEDKDHEDANGEVKTDDKAEDANGEVKADDKVEDGDDAKPDKAEDGDDSKPDGDTEDEDQKSAEDKPADEVKGEDVKEEKDDEVRAEQDMTDTA